MRLGCALAVWKSGLRVLRYHVQVLVRGSVYMFTSAMICFRYLLGSKVFWVHLMDLARNDAAFCVFYP